ncbi:MAG: hypothetical protein EPN84_00095 [Legionella sp.]|nr:MAG: hypothetical protein EPN84_00095 [Legionella sp.]
MIMPEAGSLPQGYTMVEGAGVFELVHDPCGEIVARPSCADDKSIPDAIGYHEARCEGDPKLSEPIIMLRE